MEVNEIKDSSSFGRSEFAEKLDHYALKLQSEPTNKEAFEAIHLSLHKYIIGQSFHKFIIKGQDGKDLYQESLIVLWTKAIPKFDPYKGMSFVNFAKMCINRHLITMLNSSLNRKKDQPMNTSVSLDEIFGEEDEENGNNLYNLFDDGTDFVKSICSSQEHNVTLSTLMEALSPLESLVLCYYLEECSYKEISRQVSREIGRKCNEKSIDNALLRIRRKALDLISEKSKEKDLPMFHI